MTFDRVSVEQLQALAPIAISAPDFLSPADDGGARDHNRGIIERVLGDLGIGFEIKPYVGDAERYILKHCPFNAEHNGTSSAVVLLASGAIAFKCQHNGCADKKWRDVRALTRDAEALETKRSGNGAALDLQAAAVGPLLDTDPPPLRYLVDGFLLLGIAALLIGTGSVGKGMFVLQLAVSVVTGLPFLGMQVAVSGAVMIFSAEDDRDELHRRLHRIIAYYKEINFELGDLIEKRLRERLFLFDRVGEDNRIVVQKYEGISRAVFLESIIATAQQVPDLKLIVLDPLARFDGSADENDNAGRTRLIEAVEHVRKRTRVTVLVPHHANKASLTSEDVGIEASRGGQALTDGARWGAVLRKPRKAEASKLRLSENEAPFYVHLSLPKANGMPPWPGMWLKRETGGVLVPFAMEGHVGGKVVTEYNRVLALLRDYIVREKHAGRAHAPRALRDCGGKAGIFGVGEKTLRAIVAKAIDVGDLVQTKTGELDVS